MPHLFAVLVDS